MANVKIYKKPSNIFALALTVSETHTKKIYLRKVGKCREVQFYQLHLSMANVKYVQFSTFARSKYILTTDNSTFHKAD